MAGKPCTSTDTPESWRRTLTRCAMTESRCLMETAARMRVFRSGSKAIVGCRLSQFVRGKAAMLDVAERASYIEVRVRWCWRSWNRPTTSLLVEDSMCWLLIGYCCKRVVYFMYVQTGIVGKVRHIVLWCSARRSDVEGWKSGGLQERTER